MDILIGFILGVLGMVLLIVSIMAYADRSEKHKNMSFLGFFIKVLLWDSALKP